MGNSWYPSSIAGRWETQITSLGHRVRVWRWRVPAINPELLRSVCFLYHTKEEAQRGSKFGGSGFFVFVSRESPRGASDYYIVTNKHVVEDGAIFVRLETKDGKNDPLEIRSWLTSKTDDLAIATFEPDRGNYSFYPIGIGECIYQQELPGSYWYGSGYGVGDTVFMIGRFITHVGQQLNSPTVRFGNLSVSEPVPILNDKCHQEQESLIVEARSIKGYSGSPVFIMQDPWMWDEQNKCVFPNPRRIPLLGISWGYNPVPLEVEVMDKKTRKPKGTPMRILYPNSGLMNVVPAWKLRDFLNSPEVKMQQRQSDEEAIKNGWGRAVATSNVPPKPFTRDDFMQDLNKVVRKKSKKTNKRKPKSA